METARRVVAGLFSEGPWMPPRLSAWSVRQSVPSSAATARASCACVLALVVVDQGETGGWSLVRS